MSPGKQRLKLMTIGPAQVMSTAVTHSKISLATYNVKKWFGFHTTSLSLSDHLLLYLYKEISGVRYYQK